ncbi:MAG TPA: Ig-like domain-containing protein [Micromonosporaceae bacterium]
MAADGPVTAASMLRLDSADAAQAPHLSYNVPDPTSYPGRTYTVLTFDPERDPFGTPLVVNLSGEVHAVGVVHGWHRFGGVAIAVEDGVPMLVEAEEAGTSAEAAGVTRYLPATDRSIGVVRAAMESAIPETSEAGPVDTEQDKPTATVVILTPAQSSQLTATTQGTACTVTVRVRYTNVDDWPDSLALRAGTATGTATHTGITSTGSHLYSGQITLKPGPVTLFATVKLGTATFTDRVALTINAAAGQPTDPGYPPPQVVINKPQAGRDIYLAADGQVEVEASGVIVDGGTAVTVAITVDGGSATALTPDAQRGWSHRAQLGTGSHTFAVTATDAAGRKATATREFTIRLTAVPRRRLMLVDCLRLSNFLGRYGAGRVVQTMSLLPGEQTTISMRTFRSMQVDESRTESILESSGEKATESFEDAVTAESSTNSKEQEAFAAKVTASGSGSWGVASASVSAEAAYNSASAREDAAKRVSNAVRRNAAEKSSERKVSVEGKTSTSTAVQEEQTITRTLANTNLSRTLNFVFRQMTQEFVSLLHLVDVRVGMFTEWFEDAQMTRPARDAEDLPRADYEEATLPELRGWLRRILGPGAIGDHDANVANVYRTILTQLDGVFDYTGAQVPIVEEVTRLFPVRGADGRLMVEDDPDSPGTPRPVTRSERWARFDPNLKQTWKPADQANTAGDASGIMLPFTVPGVILSANVVTLRTDGIVCDAFLGGGPALDAYSADLQRTAISIREAEAARAQAQAAQAKLGVDIVTAGEEAKADIYAKVFPPPAEPHPDGGLTPAPS